MWRDQSVRRMTHISTGDKKQEAVYCWKLVRKCTHMYTTYSYSHMASVHRSPGRNMYAFRLRKIKRDDAADCEVSTGQLTLYVDHAQARDRRTMLSTPERNLRPKVQRFRPWKFRTELKYPDQTNINNLANQNIFQEVKKYIRLQSNYHFPYEYPLCPIISKISMLSKFPHWYLCKKMSHLGYGPMPTKSERFCKKSWQISLSCSLENLLWKLGVLHPNTLSPVG